MNDRTNKHDNKMMYNKLTSFQVLRLFLAVILVHTCSASIEDDPEFLDLINKYRLSQLKLEAESLGKAESLGEAERCSAFEENLRKMLHEKAPASTADLFDAVGRALISMKDKQHPDAEQPVLAALESCSRPSDTPSINVPAVVATPKLVNPHEQARDLVTAIPVTVDPPQLPSSANNEVLQTTTGPGAMPSELDKNSNDATTQKSQTQREHEYGEVLLDEYPTVNRDDRLSSDSDDHDEDDHENRKPVDISRARKQIRALKRENGRLNQLLKLGFKADQQFGQVLGDDKEVTKFLQRTINHNEDPFKRCLRYFIIFDLPAMPTHKTITSIVKMPIDDRTMTNYFQHVRKEYYQRLIAKAYFLIGLKSYAAQIGSEMLDCLERYSADMPAGHHEADVDHGVPEPYSHSPSARPNHSTAPYPRGPYFQQPAYPSMNPAYPTYPPANSYPHGPYPKSPHNPASTSGEPSGINPYQNQPGYSPSYPGSIAYYQKPKKGKNRYYDM